MRWVQRLNEDTGKYEMIPIDASARKLDKTAAIHGPIEPYVSPIDGTVIQGRTSLREHMKKHDVVLMDDYGTDHWDNSAKSRDDHYNGRTSKQETQARKEHLNEVWNHHQRNQ